ncbi:RCC1 and BTB domain-containing protein 1 [Dermatophagoides pteronyssinus]|uniref:RCC1 and BTB domain-containing protein 1 n=1 Tax=Dermatophagoides pteronyssinus TaxID=6956 RepID=A0ABQ8IUS6_DERPT|nr:RCC1 and BTB domain-containing protein 1 [Dermatophagoides pteronyssinus]
MFSGHWKENSRVIIYDYSYDTYYAYLRMLHNGRIGIKQSNIIELIDLANCYGDERLIKHCQNKTMKKLRTDTEVDLELFQNDLKDIDREFIQNIVSIFKISNDTFWKKIGFLFMTNNATYAYGCEICKWLSLQHDPKRPQQIDILNGKKIIQVDSGNEFVVVLTDDGLVYLASDDSKWQTNNTFRLISNDGTVFALGNNYNGQLTGNSDSSYDIAVNTGLNNVKIIACGWWHSLALTNTNQIYSWGWNKNGHPIKNIVAGARHSLFLLEDGQIFGCGYGQYSINDNNDQNAMVPTKISIENVQSFACMNYTMKNNLDFSLALDQSSHYYAWGIVKNEKLLSPKTLGGRPKSFAAASALIMGSPITFGLTPTIHAFESNDTISFIGLLNNPDNYDVEFIIGDKRILALKCYLKMSSKYYSQMFSGEWQENNNRVVIDAYSYEVYYSYLRKLHTGHIRINQSNIVELIDLANCYGDDQLFKHCRTFIRSNLNEHTLSTYLPLIVKYELNDMHGKLVELTIENILPKITNDLCENKENIIKFLLWFFEQ